MKALLLSLLICLSALSGRGSSMDSVPMVRKTYVVSDSMTSRYLKELSDCYNAQAKKGERFFMRCWILVGLKYERYVPVHWYRIPYIW